MKLMMMYQMGKQGEGDEHDVQNSNEVQSDVTMVKVGDEHDVHNCVSVPIAKQFLTINEKWVLVKFMKALGTFCV